MRLETVSSQASKGYLFFNFTSFFKKCLFTHLDTYMEQKKNPPTNTTLQLQAATLQWRPPLYNTLILKDLWFIIGLALGFSFFFYLFLFFFIFFFIFLFYFYFSFLTVIFWLCILRQQKDRKRLMKPTGSLAMPAPTQTRARVGEGDDGGRREQGLEIHCVSSLWYCFIVI